MEPGLLNSLKALLLKVQTTAVFNIYLHAFKPNTWFTITSRVGFPTKFKFEINLLFLSDMIIILDYKGKEELRAIYVPPCLDVKFV